MATAHFEQLDDLLAKSDPDSSDFWDGCEWEKVTELMKEFGVSDWSRLKDEFPAKSVSWNRILVGVLNPSFGEAAQSIILAMAESENADLAFDAMRKIEFYCGINFSAQGHFVDESILDREFLSMVRRNERFKKSLDRIGQLVGKEFQLLRSAIEF